MFARSLCVVLAAVLALTLALAATPASARHGPPTVLSTRGLLPTLWARTVCDRTWAISNDGDDAVVFWWDWRPSRTPRFKGTVASNTTEFVALAGHAAERQTLYIAEASPVAGVPHPNQNVTEPCVEVRPDCRGRYVVRSYLDPHADAPLALEFSVQTPVYAASSPDDALVRHGFSVDADESVAVLTAGTDLSERLYVWLSRGETLLRREALVTMAGARCSRCLTPPFFDYEQCVFVPPNDFRAWAVYNFEADELDTTALTVADVAGREEMRDRSVAIAAEPVPPGGPFPLALTAATTPSSGVAAYANGALGAALSLNALADPKNGNGAYARVPDALPEHLATLDVDEGALSLWIRPSRKFVTHDRLTLVDYSSATSPSTAGWQLSLRNGPRDDATAYDTPNDGAVVFTSASDSLEIFAGGFDVFDDMWHHVYLSRSADDGVVRLFVDGRAFADTGDIAADGSARLWSAVDASASPQLTIGARRGAAGAGDQFVDHYKGDLDEFVVFERAQTDDSIVHQLRAKATYPGVRAVEMLDAHNPSHYLVGLEPPKLGDATLTYERVVDVFDQQGGPDVEFCWTNAQSGSHIVVEVVDLGLGSRRRKRDHLLYDADPALPDTPYVVRDLPVSWWGRGLSGCGSLEDIIDVASLDTMRIPAGASYTITLTDGTGTDFTNTIDAYTSLASASARAFEDAVLCLANTGDHERFVWQGQAVAALASNNWAINVPTAQNDLEATVPPSLWDPSGTLFTTDTGNCIVEFGPALDEHTTGVATVPASFFFPGQQPTLEVVHLGNVTSNVVGGVLPSELANSDQWRELLSFDNAVSGTVPHAYGRFKNRLTHIELASSSLSGPMPSSFEGMTDPALQRLLLQHSAIGSGLTPAFFEGLSTGTQFASLYVYDTPIGGELPSEIGLLRHASMQSTPVPADELRLSFNPHTATIPTLLGRTDEFSFGGWLDLSNTQITGRLPDELPNMCNGTDTGATPDCPSGLRWYNMLGEGPLPSTLGRNDYEVCGFVDLDVSGLGASTTSLGDLPVELFTRTSQELAVGCGWESIELRDAAVTSPLPREVGQLAGIEVLAMHRTELPGPLPAELGDVFTAADGLSEAARSPVVSLHENAIDGDLPRDFMPRVGHAIRVAIAPSVDYPMSLTEQLRDVCVSSSSNVGECSVANTVYFRFGSLYSPSDNKCLQPSLLSQTNVEEVSWMLDAAGSPCRQKDQPRWRYTAAGQFEALSLVAQQPTGKCLVYTLNNGAPVFRERPCGDRGAAALLAGDGRFSRNEFEFATLDDVRGWGALSHSSSMEKMFHSQFDVRDNLLTGSLEFEIAFNRWDVFDVSHNQLSGELAAHDFGASLWYDLSDNSFSGELPFYFKANVHSLASETLGSIDPTLDAVVDVSNNAFTGQVPYPLDYASWYSPVAGDAAGRCSFTGNQFGCARNIDVLAGWTEASDCQFDQNVVRCLATTPHTPDDAPGYTNGQDFNAPTFHTPIAYELPQFVTWEATEDATLFEPGEDSVVGAAGAASSLVVGFVTDRNDLDDGTTVRTMVERRAIIRFDSESISRSGGRFVEQFTEGVGVRAQLSLGVDVFVADPTWAQNGAIEFSVHEVVDNAANSEELWTEGTSNDTACSPSAEQCKYATVVADGVSWVHTSFVSEAWGTQGGTFKQAPVATFSLSSIDSMGTDYQVLLENDALDELVRKWLRYPELNRGIIVRLSTLFHGDASDRAAEEASLPNLPPTSGREVFVSLASRENDSSALRPQVSFRVDTADDGTFFTNFEPQGANAAKIPDQWAGDWAVSSNTSDTDELSPLNEAVLTSGATERRMWHEAGRHAFLVGDAGDEQAVQVPARSSQQFDVLYDAGIGEELGQYEAGGANDFAVGRFAGRRRRALMSFNLAPMASVDRTRIADAWVVLTAKDQAGARTAQPQCRELFETSVAPYSVQCPNGIGPVRIMSATYGNVTAAPPTCGDEPQVGNACVFDLTAALQAKCPAQQTDCEIQNADIPNEEACVNELMSSGDRAFHVRYECVYENPNGANSQQRLQLWENADTWVSGSTRGKCNAKFLATPDDVGPQNDRREATFKGHQCYEWFDTPVGGTAPSATWTRRAESLPWTSGVGGGSPVGDEPVAESTLHTTVSAQARDAEYAQTVFRSDALTALVRQWALSTDAQARGLVLRDADEDDASLGADGLATLFFSSEAGETRADQYEMQVRGGAPVGRLVNGDFAGFRPRLIVRYGTVNAEGITALSDESGGTVDFDASFASTTSNAPTPTNTYPDLLQWPVITFDSTAQAATPHRSDVPTHAWQRNPVPFASRDHQGAPNAASPPTPEYTLYSDGVARSVVGRGSLNNGDASYAGSSVSVRTPDEWYLSRGDSSGAAGGTQVVDVTTLSASSFSIHPNTTLTAPSVAPVAAPCAHVHGSAALHFSGDDVFAFGEREEEFRLRVPSDNNFRNYLFRSKFTEMWANGVAPAGHMQVMGAWVYATYPEATVTESGEYQTLFGLANRQTGSIRFGWDLELAEGVLRLCSHVGCTAGTDQVPKETWIHVFVAVRGDQGYFGWGTSDSDGQVYKFASSAPQEFEIDKTLGSAGARAVLGGHLERGDDDDDGSSSTLSSAARQPFFGLIDDVWFNLASEELLGFSLSDASTMSYDNWARMFAGHVPAAADGTCGRDNRGPPSNVRSFAESQVWLATDPSVPIWDASNSGYVFSLERQVNPVYFEHYHRDVASDATRREHCMATLRVVDASYHENGASDGKLQKPRYLPHGLVPGRLLASRELSELECSAYSDDWQHAVLSVSASRVMARMTLDSSSSTDIVEFNVFDASVAGPFHLGFFQSPEAVGGGDGSAPQPMRVDNVGVRRGVQMPWGFELSD